MTFAFRETVDNPPWPLKQSIANKEMENYAYSINHNGRDYLY